MKKWIEETNVFTYKGQEYKTRLLPLVHKDADLSNNPPVTHVLIGDEMMGADVNYEWEELTEAIENNFYFWVESDVLDLPANELLQHLKDECGESEDLVIHENWKEPENKFLGGVY